MEFGKAKAGNLRSWGDSDAALTGENVPLHQMYMHCIMYKLPDCMCTIPCGFITVNHVPDALCHCA